MIQSNSFVIACGFFACLHKHINHLKDHHRRACLHGVIPGPRVVVQVGLHSVSQPYVFPDVFRLHRTSRHRVELAHFPEMLQKNLVLVGDSARSHHRLVKHLQRELAGAPVGDVFPLVLELVRLEDVLEEAGVPLQLLLLLQDVRQGRVAVFYPSADVLLEQRLEPLQEFPPPNRPLCRGPAVGFELGPGEGPPHLLLDRALRVPCKLQGRGQVLDGEVGPVRVRLGQSEEEVRLEVVGVQLNHFLAVLDHFVPVLVLLVAQSSVDKGDRPVGTQRERLRVQVDCGPDLVLRSKQQQKEQEERRGERKRKRKREESENLDHLARVSSFFAARQETRSRVSYLVEALVPFRLQALGRLPRLLSCAFHGDAKTRMDTTAPTIPLLPPLRLPNKSIH
mmetsp:Transcript_3039/g.8237  ORF Transcript_3039/g.8237 Transcript_3039/m.8237 type:complete len:394 (-) Transcript_3039:399-1580(-)